MALIEVHPAKVRDGVLLSNPVAVAPGHRWAMRSSLRGAARNARAVQHHAEGVVAPAGVGQVVDRVDT
jgi:hypothetical protein